MLLLIENRFRVDKRKIIIALEEICVTLRLVTATYTYRHIQTHNLTGIYVLPVMKNRSEDVRTRFGNPKYAVR